MIPCVHIGDSSSREDNITQRFFERPKNKRSISVTSQSDRVMVPLKNTVNSSGNYIQSKYRIISPPMHFVSKMKMRRRLRILSSIYNVEL